ncbi:hypothetical protein N7465_006098 [Penicillium sp. CMV-2018d]|nr:hypothetical protein N7465_006098 [Penicillium sp. CMV-2018d]
MKVSTILTVAFASAASAIHYGIYSIKEKAWLMQNPNNNFLGFHMDGGDRPTKWTILHQNNNGSVYFQSVATDDFINCDVPVMCSRSKEPVLYTMEGVEEDEEDETALPDSTFFVRDAEGGCVWTTYEYSMGYQDAVTNALAAAVTLNDNQYAALVSWTFNVGKGNMELSSLIKSMNAGDDVGTVASEGLPKWRLLRCFAC